MKNILFILLLISTLLFSCKKEKKSDPIVDKEYTTELAFDLFFGEQQITSPTQVFILDNGYKVKVANVKVLFTRPQIGDKTLAESVFYDFPNTTNNLFLSYKNASFLTGDFKINLGVDRDVNHQDPSAFPLESPLNILNSGDMHWSWNPGYIFYKMELMMDISNISGEEHFDHPVSYHIGLDDNFYAFGPENVTQHSINELTKRIRLKLDFKEFLFGTQPPVDIVTESISHSTGPQSDIAVRIARAFKQNIKSY